MRIRLFLAFASLLPCAIHGADFDAATAINQLGLDLYRQLSAGHPPGNLVLSPYSISTALAMTYAGADGPTRTEMARVLHFPVDDDVLQRAIGDLRKDLDRTAAESVANAERSARFGGHTDVIEWHLANRLYVQAGYDLRSAFVQRMADGYDAPVQLLDFRTATEPARQTINHWVEAQTRERIRDLIPAGGIDGLTRLVLANALYLKAPWAKPFETVGTDTRPFHVNGGSGVPVATMHQSGYYHLRRDRGYTTLILPYLGSDLQFVIWLPDQVDGVARLMSKLGPSELKAAAQLATEGQTSYAMLSLPRFRIAPPTANLRAAFMALGMRKAFDEPPGSADFNRMAARRRDAYLAISNIFHKTFLDVNETGTEAAAATSVTMTLSAAMIPLNPIEVRVDHPFLFAIQHRSSGACLFFGCVSDPR